MYTYLHDPPPPEGVHMVVVAESETNAIVGHTRRCFPPTPLLALNYMSFNGPRKRTTGLVFIMTSRALPAASLNRSLGFRNDIDHFGRHGRRDWKTKQSNNVN